ncbi:cytochrome c3 family protein [Desulfovibrio sp. Huiquan2017]|uniref:cytochrome c3 family protein n=1 Tax=Desulfovibrio sp. Huiquan2017 TaxID=2816861 RepID=UPI001A91EFD8|nr:cytochrome c3 family protein [Desulfovibrio sp. Huiquan2017]
MLRKLLLFAAAAVLAAVTVTATQAYEVPDQIVLDRPKENRKLNTWVAPVKFPHGFHAIRLACRQCHHKESDKTMGQFVGCRQCHTDDDPTERSGFYRAWHSPGPPSCLGCHTRMRTEGGKNPVGCTTACHRSK